MSSRPPARQELALEPDFRLGPLDIRPSTCRVLLGDTEMRVEALTMSALVVFARAAGATVTKEELVQACWQGRFVSDDAIARTIAKLRLLARGKEPPPFILETVPRVGFRLIVGGEADEAGEPAASPATLPAAPPAASVAPAARRRWMSLALVAGLVTISFWLGNAFSRRPEPASPVPAFVAQPDKGTIHSSDVLDAIMSLSEDRMTQLLQAGWKIDWTLESQGSTALTWLPHVCERDHHHDQDRLLGLTKMLVAAGADPAYRNKWGDTAYIIAREARYCGPQHPVTVYLRSITPGAQADPVDKQVGARTP